MMKKLGIVLACMAAALPLAPSARATAADHVVQVGAVGPDGLPYSYTHFYPSTVEVHRHDTVEFRVPTGPNTADTQFHTVTFSPKSDEPQPGWFRPDEAPGTFAFNEPVLTGTGCGRGDEPLCVLRGTDDFFSAGSSADGAWANADGTMRPFRVKVDAPVGEYSFRCLIHDGMTGAVKVVDDDVSTANPSRADIEAELAQDTAAADALYVEESQQAPPVVENGRRVWTVKAGARTADRHVEILAYFPGTAQIATGDEVRYVAMEPHTVTFPSAVVGPKLGPTPVPFGTGGGAFLPACDLDGPSSGAPGALLMPVATSCPQGSTFELMMPLWMTETQAAPGNAVATAATVHNSGLILPAAAPEFQRGLPKGSGRHFPTEFRAVFPTSGTFSFGCSLHPAIGMRGGVSVR
jgi:plastocyanin